ncbi:MAG: CRISPR-associated protein Cas4 [Cenarchaeum symbiont of Oopsacas minuta]|nr:CRISPR-associated protein Cas4 [Cenarchaeum symbiont of Oopsacas minuta]
MITKSELDLLPISGLQHFVFCPRQFALIHIEQIWIDNVLTAEGRQLHKKAHELGTKIVGRDMKIVRGMPLRSMQIGLTGIADIVEFFRTKDGWIPFPIEYKRGKPKSHRADEIQLCAQAICLEEMIGHKVPVGAIYYNKNKSRHKVVFDDNLRSLTSDASRSMHNLFDSRITPSPIYGKYCESCSILHQCMPKQIERKKNIKNWISEYVKS